MRHHTTKLISFRNTSLKQAIVFVHGFNGDPRESWRGFADLLLADERFDDWGILSFGYSVYSSTIAAASALYLHLNEAEFSHYTELAFVTHSVGGLVVQRALVDHDDLVSRVRLAFFFASPNEGMRFPALFSALPWLQHLAPTHEYAPNSSLLKDLNDRWNQKFGNEASFEYWS